MLITVLILGHVSVDDGEDDDIITIVQTTLMFNEVDHFDSSCNKGLTS